MHAVEASVVSIDDPEDMGRIQVAAPRLGEDWVDWARILRPFGGTDDSDTPEIGEQVLILFPDIDDQNPIVLGRLGGLAPF